MNKGRRQELAKLKYKKRLKLRGVLNSDTLANPKGDNYNFTAFKHHSAPCSCYVCSQPEEKYNRPKSKIEVFRIISSEELSTSRNSAYQYLLP